MMYYAEAPDDMVALIVYIDYNFKTIKPCCLMIAFEIVNHVFKNTL